MGIVDESGRRILIRRAQLDGADLASALKRLANGQFPDAPGAWIGYAKRGICHSEPAEETLVKVLEVAPNLVDFEGTADREMADPYVAAMSLEIEPRHNGCCVIVATNDIVDRLP